MPQNVLTDPTVALAAPLAKRHHRCSWPMAWLGLLLIALPQVSVAQDGEVPYTGEVVKDNVALRAGAGRAYYVVGHLKQGATVRVHEVFYRWYRISPVEGVYSYVSKAFVDPQGDGSRGVVNANLTEVKAGSENGPGESYKSQAMLSRGDVVSILGEDGSFYRIKPPSEAFVFAPPGSIVRSDNAPPAPTPQPIEPKPTPQPVAPEPTPEPVAPAPQPTVTLNVPDPEPTPDPVVTPPTPTVSLNPPAPTPQPVAPEPTPAVDPNPVEPTTAAATQPAGPDTTFESPAIAESLITLEREMLPLLAQPVAQQPLDKMESRYTAILDDKSLTRVDRQIVQRRLLAIERNKRVVAALSRVQSARERAKAIEAPELPEGETARGTRYEAVGVLGVSGIYDGQNLPLLYRIVEPNGRRTIAYLEPDAALNLQKRVGQLVGVVGEPTYDPALKLQVIKPARLDLLAAQP